MRKSVNNIRQTIADKRMALQKMQEQSGTHKTHERPAAVPKENLSENRSKVQEVKRPVTSEKSNTPVIKRQQKVNVEHIEKARPLSSYEKNHQNDGANRRSIKSQSVQAVQKSQVHKATNRKVVSKKRTEEKMRLKQVLLLGSLFPFLLAVTLFFGCTCERG